MKKFKRWVMFRLKVLLSKFYDNVIICYGTSLTTDSGWVEELDKNIKDYKVIRFALGGINSAWGIDQLPKLLQFKRKKTIVLLEFAINDCVHENPYYRNITREESCGNMESMLMQLLAAGISPVLLLMSPPINIRVYQRNPFAIRTNFDEYCLNHRRIANEIGIKIIDVLSVWNKLSRTEKIYFMPDGIHPTKKAGKEIIAPTILKSLKLK